MPRHLSSVHEFIVVDSNPIYKGEIMSVVYVNERKRYGFFRFFIDATLTILTGGLWLIWIFVREMRKR